ncbi:MAG: DNA-binding response regulator [Alteromonadaceae bacterium]|jgi:two-component system OmpR family response regulator/two-component system response regulator RstA|uniref:Response regulator n=1 Tax=Paraglaciecola mesophila TaxID=197222 RepID=A0ABU9SX34_9ALTE|nr:DNA-binding response regulator [Alteromonadaceae bacterium]MBB20744.1 DNA-binding response regulator [Rickettsiales bacterium]|tara:strand:- start:3194 stop:3892 length:699 start_codon:yes stop_codon:yes gene_type:complete
MPHILLVEDDARLSLLVSEYLQQHNFTVSCLHDGKGLLGEIKQNPPDLVVLDVMLPGDNGFTLCKKIRPDYQGPLLFMTAKNSDFDHVLGLEIGADDYVMKPVEPRVLLARIQALLRRSNAVQPPLERASQLRFGQLTLDYLARQVTLQKEDVPLTSHEFDMLWKLASNASQLVDRNTLYRELIGREYDGLDRSADVRISRLRKKLHDDPRHPYRIKTIWGKGFYFVADAWE